MGLQQFTPSFNFLPPLLGGVVKKNFKRQTQTINTSAKDSIKEIVPPIPDDFYSKNADILDHLTSSHERTCKMHRLSFSGFLCDHPKHIERILTSLRENNVSWCQLILVPELSQETMQYRPVVEIRGEDSYEVLKAYFQLHKDVFTDQPSCPEEWIYSSYVMPFFTPLHNEKISSSTNQFSDLRQIYAMLSTRPECSVVYVQKEKYGIKKRSSRTTGIFDYGAIELQTQRSQNRDWSAYINHHNTLNTIRDLCY